MKRILILTVISAAIFAQPNFYDLVTSKDNNSKQTDLQQNTESASVEQIALLLANNSTNLLNQAAKIVDETKKPGFLTTAYNKVKDFLGFGSDSSSAKEQITTQVSRFIKENPGLITKITNSYEKLKNSNPALIDSLSSYLPNILK